MESTPNPEAKKMNEQIDNKAWLAGHAAFTQGNPCPWGDESARLGWLAARDEATR